MNPHATQPLLLFCPLNGAMVELLHLYVRQFTRRSDAAVRLGVHPRTFKAYLAGKIHRFPRDKFRQVLDQLRAGGWNDSELLETVGADDWDAVLGAPGASGSSDRKDRLAAELLGWLADGAADPESAAVASADEAARAFGNLNLALRAAMRNEARDIGPRVEALLERREVASALEALNRFESALYGYLMKLYCVENALEKAKKENVIAHIRPYVKIKESLRDAIEAALEGSGFALYAEDLRSEKIHRKKTLEFYRWELARSYSASRAYRPNEYLHHPGLGIGQVIEIAGKHRIRVRFLNDAYGVKELTANLGDFMDSVLAGSAPSAG